MAGYTILMALKPDDIVSAAQSVDVSLTLRQATQLADYSQLLQTWNARVNLTSVEDDAGVLWTHLIDSLTVLRVLDLPAPGGRSMLDVGSGAGLPGIPLKIADPSLAVTLLDGTGKKARFCEQAIAALGLAGIQVVTGRAEEMAHRPEHRERYTVVVARAVAPLPTLVEYLLPFCAPGGLCAAMKGAAGDDEAEQSAKAIAALGGALIRVERLRLPIIDHQRALIVIRKVQRCPAVYPRQQGLPRSRPIR